MMCELRDIHLEYFGKKLPGHNKTALHSPMIYSMNMSPRYKSMDILDSDLPQCTAPLQWRHNGLDSVSNHQPHECLLKRLFRRRSKKTSKLRVTGLCAGNSPETGEFPTQRASNADNVSICWRHHASSRQHAGKRCMQGPASAAPTATSLST